MLICVILEFSNSFVVNFVIKTTQKMRASKLTKSLLAAGLLGIVGYGNAAYAAKQFFELKVLLPSNGEIFNLKIETKGKLKKNKKQ